MKSVVIIGLTLSYGCAHPEQSTFLWELSASDQQDDPIADVELSVRLPDAAVVHLGKTPTAGRLRYRINLKMEGAATLKMICPPGYMSTDGGNKTLVNLVFRRAERLGSDAAQSQAVNVITSLRCNKRHRAIGLLIHSEQARGVPIKVNGLAVSAIDAGGFAEIYLGGQAGDIKQVAFDTTEFPDLRPQNPVRTLKFGERDAVEVWRQTFELVQKKQRTRHRPVRIKKLPMRIQ